MIYSNNDLFKKEISYFRSLFLKNDCRSWFFDQSMETFDDGNKLGIQ